MSINLQSFIKPITYSEIGHNGYQYDKRIFEKGEIVEARHIKIPYILPNPLYSCLPPAATEEELAEAATTRIDFNHNEIIKLPDVVQHEIIGQIKENINIYLPMYYDSSINVRACLQSSYLRRGFPKNDTNLNDITNPLYVYPRTEIQKHGTDGGCQIIGGSGCGKSTSLDPILSFYPQGIRHLLTNGGDFTQIVYLRVDCPVNNVSELYGRIGIQIDYILQRRHCHEFENMLRGSNRTTNSNRSTTLTNLVNAFGIGIIILDEAQNLNLTDKEIIELVNISNTTGVNFIFVSTKPLFPEYKVNEDNRKVIRRFGVGNIADRYCQDTNLFYSIIYELSNYQLFEPEIHMVDMIIDSNNIPRFVINEKYADVLDEIHYFSQGRIGAILSLWIEMNNLYIEDGRNENIDLNFVRKVIHLKLHQQGLISEKESRIARDAFQHKLRIALYDKDDISQDYYINDIPSDADRDVDICCELACNVFNNLHSQLKDNYDDQVLRDAVFSASLNLASKKKTISEDALRQETITILTGAKRKKAKKQTNPASKDEFFASKLNNSST
ncbi:ATP-binding protein [Aristaeella lactis]|uniref:AAA domain-containing protein n=1 Tax=Aristaeella lactis TaxID=3046383 RepID=A0AC61PJJ0_9FIRM|nr:ATP-binding protein [Aristaeella lactis]QUA54107.1 ATP-binding protein [Aristaeella lactis]SMC43580.1 AAA domain-containing protein [Aristaeella lactis]